MKKNLVNVLFEGEINKLSNINRFSSIPVIRYENVAEHSYYVSIYSLLVGLDLIQAGANVALSSLLTKSLVHDIDESISGDFLRSFKYSDIELVKIIKKNCERLTLSIFNKYSETPDKLYKHWLADKDASLEGCIVRIVDLLAVSIYCKSEINKGNKNLVYVLNETAGYIADCKEIVMKLGEPERKYLLDFIKQIIDYTKKEVNIHGK